MLKVGDVVKHVDDVYQGVGTIKVVRNRPGNTYTEYLVHSEDIIGHNAGEDSIYRQDNQNNWWFSETQLIKIEDEKAETKMTTPKMKVFCSGKYKPIRGTEDSAGLDLSNNTTDEEGNYLDFVAYPGQIVTIETKLHVQIPDGYVGLVIVRSGHGFKGLTLINSVGVIDSDYRGEVGLRFINNGEQSIKLVAGERVAQMVVVPYFGEVEHVDSLDDLNFTERGVKGFGSSGKHKSNYQK